MQELYYSKKLSSNSPCKINQHQAYCLEHPSNKIINFCTNPLCLMPLCKECIKVHTYEHYSYGTQANFETIDDVTESIYEQTKQLWGRYQNHLEKYTNYSQKLQNHKTKLNQQLALAKEKILIIVDKYFSTLQKEIDNKQNICIQEQSSQLTTQIEFISKKYQEMEEVLQKLNSDNFLKYIILMMNSSEAVEENLFAKESEKTLKKFDSQLMDVMIDKNELKNIKNSNSNLYSENSPLELQQVSPIKFTERPFSSQYGNLHERIKTLTNQNQNIVRQSQIFSQPLYHQQQQFIPQQQLQLNSNSYGPKHFHQRMPSSGNIIPLPTEFLQSQSIQQRKNNSNYVNSFSIKKNPLPQYLQFLKK